MVVLLAIVEIICLYISIDDGYAHTTRAQNYHDRNRISPGGVRR
jgi:hypothetical protein